MSYLGVFDYNNSKIITNCALVLKKSGAVER